MARAGHSYGSLRPVMARLTRTPWTFLGADRNANIGHRVASSADLFAGRGKHPWLREQWLPVTSRRVYPEWLLERDKGYVDACRHGYGCRRRPRIIQYVLLRRSYVVLFRDGGQLCSGLVDLVVGVGRHLGGSHPLALAGERLIGLVAEDIAEVGDRGAELRKCCGKRTERGTSNRGRRLMASETAEEPGELRASGSPHLASRRDRPTASCVSLKRFTAWPPR